MPAMADKPLVILHAEIKTPPFSEEARRRAGYLLRMLQRGETLSMPESRPMPSIGARCHELRVADVAQRLTWRVIYRIDDEAIVMADAFAKKTQKMPDEIIERCKQRFKCYDIDRRSV